MDFKEFKQHMQNIQDFLDESNKVDAALKTLVPDSWIGNTIGHKLFDNYMNLVAELAGDEGEWIDYYVWSCNMGKKGHDGKYMEVSWKEGKKKIKVKMNSVKALWKVIKGVAK
jgi:hypothetical protein